MTNLIEQQREHFNEISEKYFQSRKHPNHLLLKNLIWKTFLDRNAAILGKVKRVLEPMCGMAEGHDILKDKISHQFSYYGFDYSENMVDIAKKLKPDLDIGWSDVTTFRTTDELFDFIILIGGLHHVYSRTQDVVSNLKQSLQPGGYLLNFEPTHNNWMSRKVRQRIYKSNPLFDDDTEQGFEYEDLNGYFKKAGFSKVDEVYPGLMAYVLYYNPDAFPALNVGGSLLVRFLFEIDKLMWSNWVGRKLSFATMTLWRRN